MTNSMTAFKSTIALQCFDTNISHSIFREEVRQYITDGTINANIFVSFDNNQAGVVGLAWVGTTCFSNITYRASINQYFETDASTGHVR
jgi:hypothetical protein